MTDLTSRSCGPYDTKAPPLSKDHIADLKSQLDPAWAINEDGNVLTREFTFKGFAKATYMANLVAFLSDKEGHHADIAFGWGYCRVVYTSHELGQLSENDFICAAKLDALVG